MDHSTGLVFRRPQATLTADLWSIFAPPFSGLTVWTLARPTPTPRSLARFVIITPTDGPLLTLTEQSEVAISPDGTHIVYALSGLGLYLRDIDQLEATPLRGAEAGHAPFFSPDGESVGFRTFPDNILKRVSVLGGPGTGDHYRAWRYATGYELGIRRQHRLCHDSE